jgi:two-component system nitrogen regulation response regulator GlnG
MEPILVVDDEPGMLRLVKAALAHLRREVQTVSTFEDAAARLDRRPALLVTDVVLPDGNGYDLAERAEALYPGLPILVITGMQGDDPRATRWRVLIKPFLLNTLRSAAEDLLPS